VVKDIVRNKILFLSGGAELLSAWQNQMEWVSQILLVFGCVVVLGSLYFHTHNWAFFIMVLGLVCTFVGAILGWRRKD
jgi:hypothetical protein